MDESQIPEWCKHWLEPRDDHSRKRLLLLRAAFDAVAESGFEGLRTRAVASLAGVNVATLHYYFPTKQDLIQGLAQYLQAKFIVVHGPKPAPSGFPALDRLRQEFSDSRYYFACEPRMLLVNLELGVRGKRDPEVQRVMEEMHFHWRQGLEEMIQEGIASGVFRNDIARQEMLSLLITLLSGIVIAGGDRIGELERVTEAWILSDKVKKRLARQREPK